PFFLISSTTWSAMLWLAPVPAVLPPRSLTTTFAPRRASSRAYVLPGPPPAPVITATRPSQRISLLNPSSLRSQARRKRRSAAAPPASAAPSNGLSVERVAEVGLASQRRVVDAGLALVLGREALALARVVLGAVVARRRRVERQVVRSSRLRRPVRARAVRHPGVEHDDVARHREQRHHLEVRHHLGLQRPVRLGRQEDALAGVERHLQAA